MMLRLLCGLSVAVGAMAPAQMAEANTRNCASHQAITARLADIYGERRQAMGLGGNNAVVEVYASDESGSWTITVTQPGGPTCLVAAGQNFRIESTPLPEEDPDA